MLSTKERPPLLEERLERREIQHGRIGFDLTEVGIDRCAQREIRREAVLEVHPE